MTDVTGHQTPPIKDYHRPELREISKHDLTIPVEDYQREGDDAFVAEIARNFNWVKFGALWVSQRANGTIGKLCVVDGGMRLRAALRIGEITEVPCLVYRGLTRQEEAEVFLRINAP